MANIRKTFNFREGVKVDDSVLVVTGDRVGIGTTVPTKSLDVRGNVTLSGLTTTSGLIVTGVSTFADVKIGTAITITSSSGIITANKFYGDGSTLSNLPTSQWLDMDVGLGFTSIYSRGNVGVGTTDPRNSFQVGANPDTVGKNGVGIDSTTGNIKSSGIITATKFVGDGSGLTDLPIAGINTSGNSELTNLEVAGVSTFTGNIDANGGVDIDGHTELDDVNVSGASTFVGVGTFNNNLFVGDNLTVADDISADYINGIGATYTGVCTATGGFVGNLTGTADVATVALGLQAGATYVTENVTAGVGSFGKIGIGTTNPLSDIQIVNVDVPEIILGKTGSATAYAGALRFGYSVIDFPYSNPNSLDLVNYDIGNVNFYLEGGTPGVSTGDFHWHRRKNFSRLMTLTHTGKLGVGNTQPTSNLHVVGTSTVTGNANFGSDVQIFGDLTISNGLSANSMSVTSLTANVTGNVYAASGISTFNELTVTTLNNLTTAGVGTTGGVDEALIINGAAGDRFTVKTTGDIGVKTTVFYDNISISAVDNAAILGVVGLGTTSPRSVADFSDAGTVGVATNNRFMLLPSVTNAERNAISTLQNGALIFNKTEGRLEVYPNSSQGWVGVYTGATGSGGSGGAAGLWNEIATGISTTKNVGVQNSGTIITPLQVEDIYGVKTGTATYTASSGGTQTIDSFAVATHNYLVTEYTIHIVTGSNKQAQKVLVMQDGTTAWSSEYGVTYDTTKIHTFAASYSGGTVSLIATTETGISGSTTYKFVRQSIK